MPPVGIESDAMRVGVEPEFGARVVGLVDKASGRDWIYQGGHTTDVGESAVFGAEAAVGWDECFPTVSSWDGTLTMWKRRLRDHGDLWGRPWRVDAHDTQSLATTYATPEYSFSRRLTVHGRALVADYKVENRTNDEMPFLWALHGLLAASPEDHIALPGRKTLTATYVSQKRDGADISAIPFPESTAALGFRLDEVQPESARFAGKFYDRSTARSAALGHGDAWLVIGWQDPIDALGVWLNYGGWPNPPAGHHIALEPTTAPVDHLGQALDAGSATWIKPGAQATWTITLSLSRTPS